MKASVSVPPDHAPLRSRGAEAPRLETLTSMRPAAALALVYLVAHLPFLARSLEDYDSINFALGLRDFDPARHQPHPPGSPVYIAIGRPLLFLVSGLWPSLPPADAEALTLALWSAVAGAVAVVALVLLFSIVSSRRTSALWAAALVAASPLFWISGLRPMSDLPGLAAALVAQVLIVQGWTRPGRLAGGAMLAGVAAGIRIQTVWLSMPLLAVALFRQRGKGWPWLVSRPIAAVAAGTLVWAIPLVADSGGLDGYLRALNAQAGEDFAWVNMLWLEPTPRRLAVALYESFVLPWGSYVLAAAIALTATLGLVVAAAQEWRALAILLVAFVPYAVFHLLFQETIMVRYALPTVPLVAWLVVCGVGVLLRQRAWLGAAALVGCALVVAIPAGVAYGSAPHPAFQTIADASRLAAQAPPAAVYAHHSLWRALQADNGSLPVVEPARSYEWLGPVSYWKRGGRGPVWFLADPRRTDLALIDPLARADVVHYPWAVADRLELSGARPAGTDWYRMTPPGWFAEEGWSLTPETGGLAQATAAGPDHRPITAWVRRRAGPLHLLIGGRHLGSPRDPAAQFELALDGVIRDRWELSFEQRNFLRFLDIPEGNAAGNGDYSTLTVVSRAATADGRVPVAVRQFDIQSSDRLLYGFAEGWHEQEYDPMTGRQWRWTSERSVIRVRGPAADVAITLRGESPLRYFDAVPTVQVIAGDRVVAQFRPDDDFEWSVIVPAADVERGGGAIVLETDRVYLPGVAEGTGDERHLGLRIYECRVHPVSD